MSSFHTNTIDPFQHILNRSSQCFLYAQYHSRFQYIQYCGYAELIFWLLPMLLDQTSRQLNGSSGGSPATSPFRALLSISSCLFLRRSTSFCTRSFAALSSSSRASNSLNHLSRLTTSPFSFCTRSPSFLLSRSFCR